MKTLKVKIGMVFVLALLFLQAAACFMVSAAELPATASVKECGLFRNASKVSGDISFSVFSFGDTPVDAAAFLGIYDNKGTLVGIEKKNQQLSKGSNTLVFSQIEIPIKKQETHYARLFVWDQLSMVPLADETKLEIPRGTEEILQTRDFVEFNGAGTSYNQLIFQGETRQVVYKVNTSCQVFVNGVVIPSDQMTGYLQRNPVGTVQLVDLPEESGVSSTDGIYDKILITYYKTGMIDRVNIMEETAEVYWHVAESGMGDALTLNTRKKDIQIFLGEQKISPQELQNRDVLSVQYDVTGDAKDSEFYKIFVNREQVSGKVVSAISKPDGTMVYMINGKAYSPVIEELAPYLEIGTEYVLYIDKFGRFIYSEEAKNPKNYAIIDRIYMDYATQNWRVRLVNHAGSMVDYIVRNPSDITDEFVDFNQHKDVPVENRLATYKLNSKHEIYDIQIVAGNSFENVIYKAQTNEIGPCPLAENAVIIDASKVIAEGKYYQSTDYKAVTPSSLIDGEAYSIIAYDQNYEDAYYFVVITERPSALNIHTAIAVVDSAGHEENPEDNIVYPVLYIYTAGKEELQKVFVDESEVSIDGYSTIAAIPKGTAIVYAVNADGLVDAMRLVLPTPLGLEQSTKGLELYRYAADLAADGDASSHFLEDSDGKIHWYLKTGIRAWDDSNNTTLTGKARVIFGPVTEKGVDTISIAAVEKNGSDYTSTQNQRTENNYTLSGAANVYVYDCNKRVSERLSKGTIDNIVKTALPASIARETITWNTAVDSGEVLPYYALVKLVNEEATDVLFIIPNDIN